MDNQQNESKSNGNGLFNFLYRTRIVIAKGSNTIVNLSILFCLIALLVSPWLVVIGVIAALLLGYRFSLEKNMAGFANNIDRMFKDAADSVKNAVHNATATKKDEESDTKAEESNETQDDQNGDQE